MLKIAICDDEKSFTELLHKSAVEIMNKEEMNADIHSFVSADNLLTYHRLHPFDIIFLDIDMPDMSGFEAAEKIRKITPGAFIIFVTSKKELVYHSFEYTPFYFICKSSSNVLFSDIEHVFKKLSAIFKQNKQIVVSDSVLGEDRIAIKDIIYIKSDKHYLLYYLTEGDIPRRERNQLTARCKELDSFDFISPHKRYLVNMRHIKRFDILINTIIASNGDEIPISRAAKNITFEKYRIFRRK